MDEDYTGWVGLTAHQVRGATCPALKMCLILVGLQQIDTSGQPDGKNLSPLVGLYGLT